MTGTTEKSLWDQAREKWAELFRAWLDGAREFPLPTEVIHLRMQAKRNRERAGAATGSSR